MVAKGGRGIRHTAFMRLITFQLPPGGAVFPNPSRRDLVSKPVARPVRRRAHRSRLLLGILRVASRVRKALPER